MRNRIQSILIQISGGFTFLIVGITTFLLSFIIPSSKYFMAKWGCKVILLSLGVQLKVNGKFPTNEPYIIMFNHSSFIDPFLLPTFAKGKFTGVVAEENFDIFLFGWILKRLNCIPIDRKNTVSSVKSLQSSQGIIKKGYHIGILPEGTRSLDGNVKPFKKGGFHMAIETQTPILPVGINGAYNFKTKNRKYFIPGKVIISIGEPINTSVFEKPDIDELVQKTKLAIERLCHNPNL